MKLTKKQLEEKELLAEFSPELLKRWPPQEGEFEDYLAHSERGKPLIGRQRGWQNFNIWAEAKRWRGIQVHEMYEQGILDGSVPYFTLLGGEEKTPVSRNYANFLKKEIFRGIDAEIVEECYQRILQDNN